VEGRSGMAGADVDEYATDGGAEAELPVAAPADADADNAKGRISSQ